MTDDTVATWRLYVLQILGRLGDPLVKDVAQITGVSESTLRNWMDPEYTSIPDLRMVAKFAICLSQPLLPALAAAGLPPEHLGLEDNPPPKTVEQLVFELHNIANQIAQIREDPENPSTTRRRGVMRLLTNPEFSPRQDVPPL
jgi:hypothetical protein